MSLKKQERNCDIASIVLEEVIMPTTCTINKRSRPAGDSKKFPTGNVPNTDEKITCEFCGTTHPEADLGEFHEVFSLLGKIGVVSCCGALVDDVYKEWQAEFVRCALMDFRVSPLDEKHNFLRFLFQEAIRSWRDAIAEQLKEVEKIQQEISAK